MLMKTEIITKENKTRSDAVQRLMAFGALLIFFIAPFFGLAWAGLRMFFKETRQIPYGPFLSLGVLVVMIFHNRIYSLIIDTLLFTIKF